MFLILFLVIVYSCKNDNKIIDPYVKIGKMMNECFTRPSDSLFNERVKEIFKIDILSSPKDQIPSGALGMFPETIIKNNKFVIPVDFEPSIPDNESYKNMDREDIEQIFFDVSTELCEYNNMLFHDDPISTNWIKENYPLALTNLVTDYGYTGNNDWLRFTFYNTDVTQNSDNPQLHNLIFDFKCEKPMGIGDCMKGKYSLRQNVIDKMLELSFMTFQMIDIVHDVKKSPENYSGDTERLHLYLLALCYKFTDGSDLMYFFDSNKEYFKKIEAYNYFEIDGLKHFIENFKMPEKQRYGIDSFSPDPYDDYGIINDPDGYTNLRKGRGVNHPVIKKIVEGEKFAIKRKEKEWWLVVLADSTEGWIHKSRVKIIKE